jgi:uncharacterized membrane-anchored protein
VTKPHGAGGLNLDRIASSLVIAVVMVLIVVATTPKRESAPEPAA